jgi:hypothetical protein
MLGLYPEDQVTTETTTFENGIDSTKWIVDTRAYGGADNTPYMRQMDPDNVKVVDGLLELKVPGGQTYDPKSTVGLSSAQIMSTKKISVGSMEMTVKMSAEDGTCQCKFRGFDRTIASGADSPRWFPLRQRQERSRHGVFDPHRCQLGSDSGNVKRTADSAGRLERHHKPDRRFPHVQIGPDGL